MFVIEKLGFSLSIQTHLRTEIPREQKNVVLADTWTGRNVYTYNTEWWWIESGNGCKAPIIAFPFPLSSKKIDSLVIPSAIILCRLPSIFGSSKLASMVRLLHSENRTLDLLLLEQPPGRSPAKTLTSRTELTQYNHPLCTVRSPHQA